MQSTTLRRNGGIAAVASIALVLGSLGLLAAPAFAAPGDGGTGSITVTKLEQTAGPIGPSNGAPLENLGGAKPLIAGFTVCEIGGIDLGVPSAWERLKNLVVTDNPEGGNPTVREDGTTHTLTNCIVDQRTDAATGATTFANLPADKVYVVSESTPPVGAISVAQPTVVTVPYPGTSQTDSWNYHPHIYPKNVIAGSGATKDAKIVGNKVTFDITVPINPFPEGKKHEEFRINDKLSVALNFTGGSARLTAADGSAVTLDAADFTLTTPSGNAGDEVVLTLTGTGLTKLDANIGGKLVLTILADATGTGSTANEAKITVNGKSTDDGAGPAVATPHDFFAGAHIMKQARRAGTPVPVPLAGAEFAIYSADDAAAECPATPPTEVDPLFERQTSSADGTTPKLVLAGGNYCVYETKIPAGFKGLRNGMLLTVTAEDASVNVLNTQIGAEAGDLPALPLTGSAGSILLIATGVALIVLGTTIVLVRRHRNRDSA